MEKWGGEELSPSPGVTFAYIGEAPMAERVIILRDYGFEINSIVRLFD
jgi:hypothetical protein